MMMQAEQTELSGEAKLASCKASQGVLPAWLKVGAYHCRQRGGRVHADARFCGGHDRALQSTEAHTQALRLPDPHAGTHLLFCACVLLHNLQRSNVAPDALVQGTALWAYPRHQTHWSKPFWICKTNMPLSQPESIGHELCAHCSTLSFMQARDALAKLPTLVDVSIPDDKHITVCGDTHGQFYDLCNLFELNGLPSEDNPYLFNGAQHTLTLIVGLVPTHSPQSLLQ